MESCRAAAFSLCSSRVVGTRRPTGLLAPAGTILAILILTSADGNGKVDLGKHPGIGGRAVMKQHIIVCSNNPALVDAAARVLDPHRPRLTVCESGLEVLGAVEVVDADLLILDMQTPGLNGLLLIAAVRELAPSLPIVAVSTTPQEDARAVSQKGVSYATLPRGGSGGPQALAASLAQIGEIRGIGLASGAGSR